MEHRNPKLYSHFCPILCQSTHHAIARMLLLKWGSERITHCVKSFSDSPSLCRKQSTHLYLSHWVPPCTGARTFLTIHCHLLQFLFLPAHQCLAHSGLYVLPYMSGRPSHHSAFVHTFSSTGRSFSLRLYGPTSIHLPLNRCLYPEFWMLFTVFPISVAVLHFLVLVFHVAPP